MTYSTILDTAARLWRQLAAGVRVARPSRPRARRRLSYSEMYDLARAEERAARDFRAAVNRQAGQRVLRPW